MRSPYSLIYADLPLFKETSTIYLSTNLLVYTACPECITASSMIEMIRSPSC